MSWDGRQLFTRSFFAGCAVVSRGSLEFGYFRHGAFLCCTAADFGTKLEALRGASEETTSFCRSTIRTEGITLTGYFDSGAIGGPKRVGGGAFFGAG